MVKHIRTDVPDDQPYGPERDACAIYLSARKGGLSTHGVLERALGSLSRMAHRTGYVGNEGDGAGIQTDIPRELWASKLSAAGLRASLASAENFWVGHLLVPHGVAYESIRQAIATSFHEADLDIAYEQPGQVRPHALGRVARSAPPAFWQLAGNSHDASIDERLLSVQISLETSHPIVFASLSAHTVVYKVRGSIQALTDYYSDLGDPSYSTSIALCHARYSTNTISAFERTQPFALLGHNGEINTIRRLRQEAQQLGVVLPEGGSDSQDLDRTLHTLCASYSLDLVEAMELVFPPIPYELAAMPPGLREVYTRMRQSFGPYAQGPAAIVARYGDVAMASVDALGLRPLWLVETDKEYAFSSERGVIPLSDMVTDPRPLAPGEKMALRVVRGRDVEVVTHDNIRRHVADKGSPAEGRGPNQRHATGRQSTRPYRLPVAEPSGQYGRQVVAMQATATLEVEGRQVLDLPVPQMTTRPVTLPERAPELNISVLAALGWQREHTQEIASIVSAGKDPVGSLGHDGPLAVLSQTRVNLADHYKETVAVVTNPSIDRGREAEAFSTSALVGTRPPIGRATMPRDAHLVTLATPLLPGGHPTLGSHATAQSVAAKLGALTFEDLLATFEDRVAWLTAGVFKDETVQAALERLADEAIEAVRDGAQCLVIDDAQTLADGLGWLDPHLATGLIDGALRRTGDAENLRRRAGIVVRSGSVRTLHDIALLCGFGADAINPYGMLAVAIDAHTARPLEDEQEIAETQYRLLEILTAGLEKVTSTMGCHELRGYGRVCSSIGLAPGVAAILKTPNYFGSEEVGLTWKWLEQESAERGAELRGESRQPRLPKIDRFYPRFWKKVESYAMGHTDYQEVKDTFQRLSERIPVALRHVLGFRTVAATADPDDVDLSIDDYSLPFVIGAMSFGSQGELSYKAYAQAAAALNIICVNGEGGELPDIMGVYKKNRGQQVASARFGVNAEFLNSAAVMEIKIGQGAKPGEGGMLPAHKVTPQVAAARRTNPFVPLLSPSNNHDLYSIEDLAQLVDELKTVNPGVKVSVKCPVVPGIGVIAVGVAKAGADIVNLTGYDGATGAARRHALQYVGLPAEIGLVQAHRALVESGLRDSVELWCDGGMKSGEDALKMILLGANRVGFATMAMVSIGCTICRKCQDGTCHVGITTHIKTVEEAQERELPSFVPRDYDQSIQGIVRVFDGIARELQELTAQLGVTRLQDLVGRADLLQQVRMQDKVDLSPMFERVQSNAPTNTIPDRSNELGQKITETMLASASANGRDPAFRDQVMASDRSLGSHLFGKLVRQPELRAGKSNFQMRFGPSSIAGSGVAAWMTDGMDILIEGGAQDGAAKSASGGRLAVMKGVNANGRRVDGSVGKSFAYGAQGGILIAQGNADSRPCIRLSGADVILGGEVLSPLDTSPENFCRNANLKGFACEYMTSGRVVILGDPGPYAFSGMTGGVVYQMLTSAMGLDIEALEMRLAQGAEVVIEPLTAADVPEVQSLLQYYVEALEQTLQHDTANRIGALCDEAVLAERFVKIVPVAP